MGPRIRVAELQILSPGACVSVSEVAACLLVPLPHKGFWRVHKNMGRQESRRRGRQRRTSSRGPSPGSRARQVPCVVSAGCMPSTIRPDLPAHRCSCPPAVSPTFSSAPPPTIFLRTDARGAFLNAYLSLAAQLSWMNPSMFCPWLLPPSLHPGPPSIWEHVSQMLWLISAYPKLRCGSPNPQDCRMGSCLETGSLGRQVR